MPMITFDELTRLPLVERYQRAFHQVCGITLRLVPAGGAREPVCFGAKQSPFCEFISHNPTAAQACLSAEADVQQRAARSLTAEAHCCFAGMHMVAVPVVVRGQLIATWMGGQVFFARPTPSKFRKVARQLREWGFAGDLASVERSFFGTRVLVSEQFEAMRQLLTLFAQHLGESAERAGIRSLSGEPSAVRKAKEFLREHLSESVTLAQVARAAHLSPYHFCRLFHGTTGMTFTDYVARARVEKAKALLRESSARVGEVAFATGFGSLSQFNSVFRKWAGASPSDFRKSTLCRAA